MSVCSHVSNTALPDFTEFSVHACGRDSVFRQQWNNAIYFRFVDGVMSYIMVRHTRREWDEYSNSQQVKHSSGAKSDVYDCFVRFLQEITVWWKLAAAVF